MDLLRVHSQDLHEHIAQEVGECLESGLYTDLAIRCAEGQTLHAHRLVMAAVSPYLQMLLLESNELNDDVQTIEMSEVSSDEMQMLLEVVYNGVVEASIEDLRKLILLAHRLYIAIPLSNELMQGLELKLPLRSPFRKPMMSSKFSNGHHIAASGMGMSASNTPTATSTPMRSMLSSSLKSMFNGNMSSGHSGNGNSHHSSSLSTSMKYPTGSLSAAAAAAAKENAAFAKNSTPKLNIDPTTMTTILAHSQNNEHVCPICNSKYSNVGNFKQHMKTHDNEELREQRNAILSEMIATCFNPQTSLYTCHVCNSNYNHSGNFKQHLLKHERESGSISATLVAQAGANPHLTNVLQSAMADRVDSGDKPVINQYQYQCEHCDRSFKHPGNYKQHLASHMKSTKFEPNSITNTINKVNSILGQQKLQSPSLGGASGQSGMLPLPSEMLSPSVSMNSSNKSDSMQMVACPECQLEFPGIDLLQAHISVSHKHLDVKLPNSSASTAAVAQAAAAAVASAATAASSQGNEGSNGSNDHDASGSRPSWHAALEDSQEPFKCNICGKGFQKTSKLTAHMKIHRAPEEHYNHPCDICGKKFTRPQHVARHKMLHTGERPFKCPKCPRQFTREDKLRHHLSESECGGGTGLSGESHDSPVSMGMQFGSLWGGANGEMLAGIYNNSSSADGDATTNGNDNSEEMDQSNAHGYPPGGPLSEASNDSNSNIQAGVMAT